MHTELYTYQLMKRIEYDQPTSTKNDPSFVADSNAYLDKYAGRVSR